MTAAIILAGGRSSRLGRAKEDVIVDGRTLLEHTIAACVGSSRVVVVGPPRDDLVGVDQVREEPVHGGPVAGLAAALPLITDDEVLVLACDMPRVAEVVAALAAVPLEADVVVARDRGRTQHLALRCRTAALARVLSGRRTGGASMRSVLDDLQRHEIDVPDGCTDDVDTPDDLLAAGGRR